MRFGNKNLSKEIVPLTKIPNGVKNNAAAPSKDGHQSFKNLPILSIFFWFFGSPNQFINLLNANPRKVKIKNFKIRSRIL